MNYRAFCNYVRENILNYFPDKYAQSEVTVDGTMKNNGVFKQGLSLRIPDINISPKVYLEEFYRQYDIGIPLETICQKIADEYQRHIVEDIPFAMESIANFEQAKSQITMKVVSAKTNKILLRERPFTRIDDLAVFYQIELGNIADGRASIPVTNEIFQRWNVTLPEIHKIAVENTERMFPSKLTTMEAALFGMEENFFSDGEYEQSNMSLLILTNSEFLGGACAIANPDILHKVSEVINDSFYVLPSSVHEVIIMPQKAAEEMRMSAKEMGEMVRGVNVSQVSKEEQLSDHIYEYDKERKIIETVKDSKVKSMDRACER